MGRSVDSGGIVGWRAGFSQPTNGLLNDAAGPVEQPKSAGYLLALGYVILFAFFLSLMNMIDNVVIPIALPVVWIILLYELAYRGRSLEDLGIKRQGIVRETAIGVGIGFAMSVVALASGIAPVGGGSSQSAEDLSRVFVFAAGFSFPLNLILEMCYIFAFLAPAEEILFRGYLQNKLSERTSALKALVIQSLAFAAPHILITLLFLPVGWVMMYGLSAFVAAAVFGIVFMKRNNNLIACWVAHAFVNSAFAAVILIPLTMGF